MAKKKTDSKAKSSKTATKAAEKPAAPRITHSDAYEAALKEYETALGLLHQGNYQTAFDMLKKIEVANADELELAERARTYAVVCARRLAPASEEPRTAEDRYYRAVVLANNDELDKALEMLDQAVRDEPQNVSVLYARASVRALQGKTVDVVADLRQAILIDPTVRYQAVNDPDFEKVRDDAAFIDLIEPTPTGA